MMNEKQLAPPHSSLLIPHLSLTFPRPVEVDGEAEGDDAEADERLSRRRDERVVDEPARGEQEDEREHGVAEGAVRALGVRHPAAEDEDRGGVESRKKPRRQKGVTG